MTLGLSFALIALLGLMAFIRLAPSSLQDWHQTPPATLWAENAAVNTVIPLEGGAILRLSLDRGAPLEVLAKLDAIAKSDPRTSVLAGSPADGRITWITRSALWGFPDYTTAEAREEGLFVYARLRFGRKDFGVNAARLSDWLSRL